jgi:hypothetical protein
VLQLEQPPNGTKRKGGKKLNRPFFGTYLLEFVQHVLGLYGRVGLDDDRLGGNVGGNIRHSLNCCCWMMMTVRVVVQREDEAIKTFFGNLSHVVTPHSPSILPKMRLIAPAQPSLLVVWGEKDEKKQARRESFGESESIDAAAGEEQTAHSSTRPHIHCTYQVIPTLNLVSTILLL